MSTDRQTAGPIRCHDAGPTGGVLLFLCLLRGFWALGEHKAKARHLLALVLLSSPLSRALCTCLRGARLLSLAALDNGAAGMAGRHGMAWHDGRSDLTSDD